MDEKRNQSDLRAFLRHLALEHVSGEFSRKALERDIEEHFRLEKNSLDGKLDVIFVPINQSKAIYRDAVIELEQETTYIEEKEKIRENRDDLLRQKSECFEELYLEAEETQKSLGEWLNVSFEKKGVKVLVPEVKARERALEKIQIDYEGEHNRIRDLSRFTILCETFHDLFEIFQHISNGGGGTISVVQVKNRFQSPTPLGYSDININVRFTPPKTDWNHLAEIQLNVDCMNEAKREAHKEYEKIREGLPKIFEDLKKSGAWPIASSSQTELSNFQYHVQKKLHVPVIDSAVDRLLKKSEGLFQYAWLLEQQINVEKTKNEKIELDRINALPSGLHDMYQCNFDRVFLNGNNDKSWLQCLEIIELVCASQEPLPKTLLEATMGGKERFQKLHDKISLLFPLKDDRLQVMHKSVIDWLKNKEEDIDSLYHVRYEGIKAAHGKLFKTCLTLCKERQMFDASNLSELPEALSYALHFVIFHACESGDEMNLNMARNELLLNYEYLWTKNVLVGPSEAFRDFNRYCEAASNKKKVDRTVYLLTRAIELSLSALFKDGSMLSYQLLAGRLSMAYEKEPNKEIMAYKNRIQTHLKNQPKYKSKDTQLIWHPVSERLVPAGSPCLKILKGHTEGVSTLTFSSNGSRICSASWKETLRFRVWDATTGKCLQTFVLNTSGVTDVTFNSDGSWICSGSDDATVRVWDVSHGKCLQRLVGHTDGVSAVAFSPDNSQICSGSWDKTVRVWDVTTGKFLHSLEGHTDAVKAVVFSSGSSWICSGSNDETIRLWDATIGKCLQTFEGHTGAVKAVAFSPDGSLICSGSNDKTVRVWDASCVECFKSFEGHTGWVTSVAFSCDGTWICSGSDDKTVRVWNTTTGLCLQTLQGHTGRVHAVSFSPDGSRFCSGSEDKTVRVWDANTGKCRKTLEGHTDIVEAVGFSLDGARVCSASRDKTIRVWDASTGKCLQTLVGHTGRVDAAVLSSDGSLTCSGGADATVRVWDATTGKCLQTIVGHTNGVSAVAFSPNGSLICSGSLDASVRVWDATTGKCLKTLLGHANPLRARNSSHNGSRSGVVSAVTFRHDGLQICSASWDKTIRVWNTTGECVNTLEGHTGSVFAVAFSSDGSLICSGSEDKTVRVWDTATGECIQALQEHNDVVKAVGFGSNDGLIWSGSADKTVYLWDFLQNKILATSQFELLAEDMGDCYHFNALHEKMTGAFVVKTGKVLQLHIVDGTLS